MSECQNVKWFTDNKHFKSVVKSGCNKSDLQKVSREAQDVCKAEETYIV